MIGKAPDRLTVSLSFDFDALSLWIGAMGATNPSMISRGEFGAVAIPRILSLLRQYEARATFFIPGHTAYAYPDTVRAIASDGHEIAHHGWVHENPAGFDKDGERRNLELGIEALERFCGQRPLGYRSPAGEVTEHTVPLLLEYGFQYDSSFMGNEFFPYYLRSGDQWSPTEPYVFGETTELVEVPFNWCLTDFTRFEFIWDKNPGFMTPSAVQEIWLGDFDYAYANSGGGIYMPTLHPQVIGRGHRFLMFEKVLRHISEHDDVVFEPILDYVAAWKSLQSLDEWKRTNPVHAGGEWHEGASEV